MTGESPCACDTGAHQAIRQSERNAAWLAIFSLAFGIFGLVTAELLPVSILTPIANDLGASKGAIGQAVTTTGLVAAISGPIVVTGMGAIDRRTIISGLMLLMIGSCILAGTATSVTVLLLARAMLGVALGGFYGLTTAVALRIVPSAEVPRAISMIAMGVSLAIVFAAPLAVAIGELLGWRATFLSVACIGAASLLVQLVALPRLPASGGTDVAAFRTALSRRGVLIGIVASIIIVSGHFAGFTFIRPFLEIVPRLSFGSLSMALFAFGIAGIAGNMAAGALAARSPASAFAASALFITLAATFLILFGRSTAGAFAATALWGFAFGGVPVAASIWNARIAPDIAEPAGALLASAFQIAIAGGALFGGILIDTVGPEGPIALAAAATLIGGAFMVVNGRAIETRHPHKDNSL